MKQVLLTTSLVASLCLIGQAQASETVLLEKCGPLVDQFAFVLDASGSMMKSIGEVKEEAQAAYDELIASGEYQARVRPVPPHNDIIDGQRRMELAKAFVERTSKVVLEKADMTSALYTVAPYTEVLPSSHRSHDDYQKAMNEKITEMEVFGRPTWCGQRGQAKFSEKLSAKSAFVLVTDGHFDLDTEGKVSPIDVLRKFGEANPTSCLHIVSAAYTPEEKKAVEALAKVNACTMTVELEDLMLNDELFNGFVEDVFFKDCSKVAVIEIQDLYFDFDKSDLTPDSVAKLEKALKVIQSRDADEKITVVGWTDWVGTDAYNAKLSDRRANAVKAFFVERGIDADRLTSRGQGESMKYDNHSAEGRHMNRRVELEFQK